MSKPVIHLWSIAGSDRDIARQLGLKSTKELVDLVRGAVGSDYRVSANTKLIEAKVDVRRGGRGDDLGRVRDIEGVLADDRVIAVVSLRGGSWLARLLPHINFDLLKKRKTILHVFGFSELTSLINIVSRYAKVRAHYDMGPGFARWGLRNFAVANYDTLSRTLTGHTITESARAKACGSEEIAKFALGWSKTHFKQEFVAFFRDVVEIISGRGSQRTLSGELVRGSITQSQKIRVAGGCLSTLVTLLGSPYRKCLDLTGRWLALEDIREDIVALEKKTEGLLVEIIGGEQS